MIKEKLKLVPNVPGCYLMKNDLGIIIYVGKAKNLKKRLSSYFRGKHYGKTAKLISEIIDFEYLIVNSETESLILELNLIKKYDPKYNVLLRDDKTYPYIELTNEKVPRLLIVRKNNIVKKGKKLFGPYPNVYAARKTVDLLNQLYPLRKCTNYSKKECLYYHINECLGYCTKSIKEKIISNMVSEITKFLSGDHALVTRKIKEKMLAESANMHYEKAKELKDLLDYINITLIKQNVELKDNGPLDVFGYYIKDNIISIEVLFIRGGKIIEHSSNIFDLVDEPLSEVSRYIASFYKNKVLPKEMLVPDNEYTSLLSNYFNIIVKCPLKGDKLKLINMATNNAKNSYEEMYKLLKKEEEKTTLANEKLKEILKLDKLDRIELFDNSNLFGSFNVSGMVVFKNGLPSKKDYRKYKISINKNDDYGTMKEVIYRRYFRVLKDNLERPDLIIVDGALSQINAARTIINDLRLNIAVCGLKKDDKHKTKALLAFNPIKEIEIDKSSNLFFYLERMQDEVHNYTIYYHKQIRSKGALTSILDNIEGIGPKRKNELIKKYKTLTNMQKSSVKELEEILPKEIAKNFHLMINNNK